MKPLCIDLFCGLGGWTEGFLAEGYDVIGFDIERRPYLGQLVLQDVLTLHGSQFRNAAVIVASPPCQAYSYRAMPWKRAKALPPPDNTLFETCFRIQREACEAAGRYIPLVVENVRGAEKWVGAAAWHFGSYYLWGDIPALMPIGRILKRPDRNFHNFAKGLGSSPSFHGADHETRGLKVSGQDWNRFKENGTVSPHWRMQSDSFGWSKDSPLRNNNSPSDSRKAASAQIAKIPFPLAQHIARVYKPDS